MALFKWIQSKQMVLPLNCLLKTSPEVTKEQHPFLCCEPTAAPKNSTQVRQHCQWEQHTLCLSSQRQYAWWYTSGISSCSPSHMVWMYSKIMFGFNPEPPPQSYSSRRIPNRQRKYLIAFVTMLLATELPCIEITFFPLFMLLVFGASSLPINHSCDLCKQQYLSKKLLMEQSLHYSTDEKNQPTQAFMHSSFYSSKICSTDTAQPRISPPPVTALPPSQADTAMKYFHSSALTQPLTESPPGMPKGVL